MGQLRFGAWIPTYAWADDPGGAENAWKIRESVLRFGE